MCCKPIQYSWEENREKIIEAFQNSSLKGQNENWNIRKVK